MNYDFYENMSFIDEYKPAENNIEISNPYEGFLKGNAFKNQFIPYKDYKIQKVGINSEKEELLFNISEYCFMMHDMNLYLDIYPNNKEVLNKFNEYRKIANDLIIQYERKYGPLMVSNSDDDKSFAWISKWPWVN